MIARREKFLGFDFAKVGLAEHICKLLLAVDLNLLCNLEIWLQLTLFVIIFIYFYESRC